MYSTGFGCPQYGDPLSGNITLLGLILIACLVLHYKVQIDRGASRGPTSQLLALLQPLCDYMIGLSLVVCLGWLYDPLCTHQSYCGPKLCRRLFILGILLLSFKRV